LYFCPSHKQFTDQNVETEEAIKKGK